MKHSKPSALANWLLEHVRFGTADGVIAGDLLEEFHRGRSAAWYYRQVLIAIVVGYASELRRHRVLAAWVTLITWLVNYGAIMLGRRVISEVFPGRLLTYHPVISSVPFALAMWGSCFLGGVGSGLIVAFLGRAHRNAMLLTGAGALLGWALMAIVFLKKGSLQHPLPQIAGAAIIYYLIALAGFATGGFLLTPAPKPAATPGEHGSAIC